MRLGNRRLHLGGGIGLSALAALALSAACGGARPAGPPVVRPPAPPVTAAPSAVTATPPLPPGVLFDEPGPFGRVRVADQQGLRLLTVNDEVMGGASVARLGAEPEGDPLVELITLAERRGPAVVLGLGTGRTATELARRGPVVVVERDPLVVRAAREHFGFRGSVETLDAVRYLARATSERQALDVLVLDTLGADESGDDELLRAALELVRSNTSSSFPRTGPLLALRFWGAPGGERAERIRAVLRRQLGNVELFGSGVADEEQTIYALGAPSPENLVAADESRPIAAWRIADDALGRASRRMPRPVTPSAGREGAETLRVERELRRERAVELVGYLVRAEDGALCLDLPHYEMGALRYRLRGERAAELGRLLPNKAAFPTSGDIGSDGPTDGTLRELLGGGGFKRNETRFSAVAVALVGRARLVAFVHPDASAFVPSAGRGREPDHAALRYGGALYDLEVDRVLGTVDLAAWRKSVPALRAALPLAAIEQGALEKAAAAAAAVEAQLTAVLGPVAPFAQESRLVTTALGAITDAARATGTDLGRALGCDRALTAMAVDPNYAGPLSIALDRALFACATRFYERALGPKPSPASEPARRLLGLYRARAFDTPALERKAAALEARLPGVEELDTPPVGFGLPLF